MPKFSEDKLAIGFVAVMAVWTLVVLPILYHPALASASASSSHSTFWEHLPHWFVALFTLGLLYVTHRLAKTTGDLRASTDKLWEAGERQMELIERNAAQQSLDMQASVAVAGKAASATQTSANAASASVQISKGYLERGYVFGGCGEQRPIIDPNGHVASMVVHATHGNYGKTPAFVECIFIEHCLEKDLPTKPEYKEPIAVNDPLPPTGLVRRINRTERRFDVKMGRIYYGRIIYLDVFKVRHYSSFIYRFNPDGTHEPLSNIDPEYWAWGRKED